MSLQIVKQRKTSKRKLDSNESHMAVNEFHVKILHFLIENLIPFDSVTNSSFKNLLLHLHHSAVQLPDVETLLHLANQMYNDYQNYFREYFANHEEISISLTCHSYQFLKDEEPYIFLSASYIDSRFKLCELPLGVFNYNSINLSNLIVRNTFLNNYKGKLNFITSNCSFDERCLDIFKFVINEPGIDIKDKVLPCVPSFLNSRVEIFLNQLRPAFELEHPTQLNINSITSSDDVIPHLTQVFLGPIYTKFKAIPFTLLSPCNGDEGGAYLDILKSTSKNNDRNITLMFLNSCLVYKDKINEISDVGLTDLEWQLVDFLVQFNRIICEIIIHIFDNSHATSHMALKWLKILIIKLISFEKLLDKNYPLIETKISQPLKDFLASIESFHIEMENKYDLILSSYLHPSTKRLLKEKDVNKISSNVEKLSKNDDPHQFETSDIESLLLKTFNCLGSSTECYDYETSAASDMNYQKQANFLAKESGPFILQFWKKNKKKYPILSKLARKSLSIQICSDRRYESFKMNFDKLSTSIHNASNSPCTLQELFFLNRLSEQYDLSSFDPKCLDSNIEDVRLESDEVDIYNEHNSTFQESTFLCSSEIEITENDLTRKSKKSQFSVST